MAGANAQGQPGEVLGGGNRWPNITSKQAELFSKQVAKTVETPRKPNNLEECLRVLSQIKESELSQEYYITQLEKIERYVRGEITSQELLVSSGNEKSDNLMKVIVYKVLNKIITFKDKDIRYYIQLPQDVCCNTSYWRSIVVAKIESIDIDSNHIKVFGPSSHKLQNATLCDDSWIEITGDFSDIPKGAMIHSSDWYKIISKYPKIYEVIHSANAYESERYRVSFMEINEMLVKWACLDYDGGKKEYLTQEVIDSISYEIPTRYLPIELVKSGEFGSFQEILDGKYIPQQTQETPKIILMSILRNRFREVLTTVTQKDIEFLRYEKDLILAKLKDEKAKLLGFYDYQDQLRSEEWDAESRKKGFKSFRDEHKIPGEKVIPEENQAKTIEITAQIEEIEWNWKKYESLSN